MSAAKMRELVDAAPIWKPPESELPPDDKPLAFDLTTATVDDLLNTEPPARQWIVSDRLPLGIVGLLGAAGGTGKSIAVLQLAVSACCGMDWLGMPVECSGGVLIMSAEDDRPELHRRLHAVMSHYRQVAGKHAHKADAMVAERLRLLDLVGADNRLTCTIEKQTTRTALVEKVINTVRDQLPGCVLIVLDPLSRFDGGDPNDNSDGTRLIEAAEAIRKATGATVLLPHHVNKASTKADDAGAEALRGASGLVDGARWVGLLQTLRRDQAKDYGIESDDAGKFLRFTTPKANYSAPWGGIWLERLPGGVLVPTELEQTKGNGAPRGQQRYAEVLPTLTDLLRRKSLEGKPLTRRALRQYAGTAGIFGMGESALSGVVGRAMEEGHVREVKPEGVGHGVLEAV